ncbi:MULTISPECIES: CbiX/SirB N-terminal domain-containing protein [Ramlibacter]|uniref:CbiX/SirB N-terminal domain-containing protein n=1 Tax=Ramlibacter aquaticus TaxID=2780094 RepID=A0ABR9SFA8_9BURK|nr:MULTISPECIES: CbiX/SirB N-terminal domain-containing protein [Ramlibacter]MBE7941035.1 CbiX/SirB N-terminal domain-containing protein [Ramlibacter aquaticus]
MTRGILLFGHGSRDPLWRAPMDAVAARVRASGALVECGFLELQAPDMAEAGRRLAAAGARQLVVLPMFLGTGKHAREDLPGLVAQLREAHPTLAVEVLPAVGEDPRVLDLLARLVLEGVG